MTSVDSSINRERNDYQWLLLVCQCQTLELQQQHLAYLQHFDEIILEHFLPLEDLFEANFIKKLSSELYLTVATSSLASQQTALIAVRMTCDCALKTWCCVLLNVSLIASSLTASSCSLQSLCLCRVEVLKFVHPFADAKEFVLDF